MDLICKDSFPFSTYYFDLLPIRKGNICIKDICHVIYLEEMGQCKPRHMLLLLLPRASTDGR